VVEKPNRESAMQQPVRVSKVSAAPNVQERQNQVEKLALLIGFH